jgi:UbiD family decarboxylase
MKHFTDLRGYIDALDELGDLVRITREVDGDLESAAITRRSYELRSRAPLFENIHGARPGFRVFGAPAALSSRADAPYARVALSLGLPPQSSGQEIVEALLAARYAAPVPPVLVDPSTAPCRQNVLRDDQASLDRFPIPMAHEHDGGRYANTWGTLIVKTPDGSWVNWSITRVMKVDGKRMTGPIVAPQHLGVVWEQWVARGEPMPFALVQGPEPAISCVSGIPVPTGVNEADYLGALLGEPVQLVKALTVDLEVPATAEIVIEGHVSLERDSREGPFGEYAGYLGTATSMQPTYHVEAITHRDAPIWPLVAEGRPVDECHTIMSIGYCADAIVCLREADLPVKTVWAPPEPAGHWYVVIAPSDWRDRLPGVSSEEYARRVGEALFATKPMAMVPKLILLDDDIDPTNLGELTWAIATRVHPTQRHVVLEDRPIAFVVQSFTEEEYAAGRGSKVVYDGLQPPIGAGRLLHSSFAQAYPAELRKHVIEHWQ